MKKLALRTRIFLSYLLLIGLAVIVIIFLANRQIVALTEATHYAGFEHKTTLIVLEAEELFDGIMSDEPPEVEAAFNQLRDQAIDLEISVQLIHPKSYEVFFDSKVGATSYKMEETEDLHLAIEYGEPINFEDYETGWVYRSEDLAIEGENTLIVRTGQPSQSIGAVVRSQMLFLTAVVLGVGCLLLIILGSWLANALTRPLIQLGQTAREMAVGNLSTRASTNAPSEVALLAQDFNQMAEAVEKMIAEQRSFASNAAHELRTPLTAIRLRTETLLEDDADEALIQQYITEIDAEALGLDEALPGLGGKPQNLSFPRKLAGARVSR